MMTSNSAWYKSGVHSLDPRTPGIPRNPWDSQDLRIFGTPKNLRTWDPLGPHDLRTFGKLPLPFEVQDLSSQKLKHEQKISLNYIIGQSQTKAENCVHLVRLFYLSSC